MKCQNKPHSLSKCARVHIDCWAIFNRYTDTQFSKMLRKLPIIVILGSTATGKTKLSIELARRFRGEIISADSMQIYKGLDISTAKATRDEQSQAVHHLLDVRDACSDINNSYHVVDFRDAALPIIDRLFGEEKIPIIVGGTNYYIESILWKVLVQPPLSKKYTKHRLEGEEESDKMAKRTKDTDDEIKNEGRSDLGPPSDIDEIRKLTPTDLLNKDPESLHQLLTQVDPVSAKGLHPNNTRKVRRALEVFIERGERISDVHARQREEEGSSYLGGPLRYDHTILFWIKSDQEVLNQRIDRRIDGMVADGLLQEIRKFYNDFKSARAKTCGIAEDVAIDCTKGMFQAIGIKEFVPYLEKYPTEASDVELTDFIRAGGSSKSEDPKPEGIGLLEECLDMLRLRTKRYSKTQIKWVANRLISPRGRHVPPVYVLDSTHATTRWTEDVFLPAQDVVESYLADRTPKLEPEKSAENPRTGLDLSSTFFCTECDRRFIGEYQWNLHRRSNAHKRTSARRKRLKLLDEIN